MRVELKLKFDNGIVEVTLDSKEELVNYFLKLNDNFEYNSADERYHIKCINEYSNYLVKNLGQVDNLWVDNIESTLKKVKGFNIITFDEFIKTIKPFKYPAVSDGIWTIEIMEGHNITNRDFKLTWLDDDDELTMEDRGLDDCMKGKKNVNLFLKDKEYREGWKSCKEIFKIYGRDDVNDIMK